MIYDNCRSFSEGYAAVMIDDKIGFIDKSGQMAIKPQFDIAYDFTNGLGIASKDGKLGYIDKRGAFMIQPKFERVLNFIDINQTNFKLIEN